MFVKVMNEYRVARFYGSQCSYNGRLRGSRILAFDWYQFRWTWIILNDHNVPPYAV